jgi:hypothetical protein
MCWKHWRTVPRKIQSAVYAAYRVGQCDDMNPSQAWHIAADAAIGYVAVKEGQKVRTQEETALLYFGYEADGKRRSLDNESRLARRFMKG